MPSLRQEGIVVRGRTKNGKTFYIVIAKKTGFMDVWIGNQHFYYNYTGSFDSLSQVDIEKIIDEVQRKQSTKKTIVIRRK